jgi:hypothetical protein
LLGIRDRLLLVTDLLILANAALSVGQSYKNFYVVEGLSVVIKTRTGSRLLKRRTTFRKLHFTIAQPLPSAKTAFGQLPAFVEPMNATPQRMVVFALCFLFLVFPLVGRELKKSPTDFGALQTYFETLLKALGAGDLVLAPKKRTRVCLAFLAVTFPQN